MQINHFAGICIRRQRSREIRNSTKCHCKIYSYADRFRAGNDEIALLRLIWLTSILINFFCLWFPRKLNHGNWTPHKVWRKLNWLKTKPLNLSKMKNIRWPSNCMKNPIHTYRISQIKVSQPNLVIISKIDFLYWWCRFLLLDEPNSEAQKVKAAVYLNIALCYMKVRNYGDARRAVS